MAALDVESCPKMSTSSPRPPDRSGVGRDSMSGEFLMPATRSLMEEVRVRVRGRAGLDVRRVSDACY